MHPLRCSQPRDPLRSPSLGAAQQMHARPPRPSCSSPCSLFILLRSRVAYPPSPPRHTPPHILCICAFSCSPSALLKVCACDQAVTGGRGRGAGRGRSCVVWLTCATTCKQVPSPFPPRSCDMHTYTHTCVRQLPAFYACVAHLLLPLSPFSFCTCTCANPCVLVGGREELHPMLPAVLVGGKRARRV